MHIRFFSFSLFVLLMGLQACTSYTHLSDIQPNYLTTKEAKEVDPEIETLIAPFTEDLGKEMNTVIGQTAQTLSKSQPESTLGNWVGDLVAEQCAKYTNTTVDFGIANYGGLRIPSIPEGGITKGKIFELMPFDNMLVVVEIKGNILETFFHHMARKGGWPISKTVSYQITPEGKATKILIHQKPIDPDKIYRVGMNDYISNGGDNCDFLVGLPSISTNTLFRDAILEYVEGLESPIQAKLEQRVVFQKK